ncbi:hypothetical protein EVAR_63589_1 [Eumeta japonica]|uniref:Uncharacterized protein n=1 Tax=Eumeta variegata TaxID=151549 RepID=A0A4C1ZKK4_EUMVA|nr:hypothetical protein EVAR_63589_1 [Eumeta japonica]
MKNHSSGHAAVSAVSCVSRTEDASRESSTSAGPNEKRSRRSCDSRLLISARSRRAGGGDAPMKHYFFFSCYRGKVLHVVLSKKVSERVRVDALNSMRRPILLPDGVSFVKNGTASKGEGRYLFVLYENGSRLNYSSKDVPYTSGSWKRVRAQRQNAGGATNNLQTEEKSIPASGRPLITGGARGAGPVIGIPSPYKIARGPLERNSPNPSDMIWMF